MKRAIFAVLSTVAGLIFVLGYDPAGRAEPETPPAAQASATPQAQSRTVVGPAVQTAQGHGGVQVTVVLTGARITEVSATQDTDAPRSIQLSGTAFPRLRQEVLAAQSADVDTVSGATMTSEAYLSSLRGALEQA